QTASPVQRMPSSSTVFARCTNSLSTRWAIRCPSLSRPPFHARNGTPDLLVRLSPQPHTRVATRAWLSRSFIPPLRDWSTATAAVPHGRHPADRSANRAHCRDVRDSRVRGLLGHRAQPRSGETQSCCEL